MKTITLLTITLSLSGCAGVQMKDCLNEQQEPVSTCRAEAACGKGSFRSTLGLILSGAGSGASGQQNMAASNYDSCIDRELSAQRLNAGLQDNTIRCQSRVVASDGNQTTVESKCY